MFFDIKCAVGNGDCALGIYLSAVASLAMKWSNMTDFKWKSGNLVSLSCTVIMSNFHYGDLHSCRYRVIYLLYLLKSWSLLLLIYDLFYIYTYQYNTEKERTLIAS